MALEILKGSAKFEYGWSSASDLSNWLQKNPDLVAISFVGRSNVGKSSIINSLFGKGTARVSKTPGRTREINAFSFKLANEGKEVTDLPKIYLFDLPGYGHAEISKEMAKNWEKLMGVFFAETSTSNVMVNLQDARHPNQKADIGFHQFLKSYDFQTFLVFNKMDKLKNQKERAVLNKLKPQLFKEYKWVKQIHFVSAESKMGLAGLHDAIVAFIDHKIKLNERAQQDNGTDTP